jgi:riboflavin synthase
MFTGIIMDVGQIRRMDAFPEMIRISVATAIPLDEVRIGDSIALNGVCQTVVAKSGEIFVVEAVRETLRVSSLGHLRLSSPVNLELALRLQDRLGGHLVSGHVDGMGEIKSISQVGSGWELAITLAPELAHYLVKKGSVCVDGISLTIANVSDQTFTVAVIPHTFAHTNLHGKKIGEIVNIETDIIGKYIYKYMHPEKNEERSRLTVEFLQKHGMA